GAAGNLVLHVSSRSGRCRKDGSMMDEVAGDAQGSAVMAALRGGAPLSPLVSRTRRSAQAMRRRAGTQEATRHHAERWAPAQQPTTEGVLRCVGGTRAELHLLPPQLERIFATHAFLLFRALPDHARKTLQRHQRLAGVSPFLQLLDRDVIERLAAGA